MPPINFTGQIPMCALWAQWQAMAWGPMIIAPILPSMLDSLAILLSDIAEYGPAIGPVLGHFGAQSKLCTICQIYPDLASGS